MNQNIRDISNYIGYRLHVWSKDDGDFDATLIRFNPENSLYHFNDVQGDKIKKKANLSLFSSEIESIKVLNEKPVFSLETKDELTLFTKNEKTIVFIPSKESDEEDAFVDINEVDRSFDDEEEEYFLADLSLCKSAASNEVIKIVDEMDKLSEMIKVILGCEFIGLACLGDNISRFSPIEFILISCHHANYVIVASKFNVQELKNILESESLLKILHGCNIVSDALYHQHGVKLEGVYDTSVIDAWIRREYDIKKKFPNNFRDFNQCVKYYLGINLPKQSNDYFKVKGRRLLQISPLSKTGEGYVRSQCLLLNELRLIQSSILFNPINSLMKIFLKSFRDASDIEYSILKSCDNLKHLLFSQAHLISDKNYLKFTLSSGEERIVPKTFLENFFATTKEKHKSIGIQVNFEITENQRGNQVLLNHSGYNWFRNKEENTMEASTFSMDSILKESQESSLTYQFNNKDFKDNYVKDNPFRMPAGQGRNDQYHNNSNGEKDLPINIRRINRSKGFYPAGYHL